MGASADKAILTPLQYIRLPDKFLDWSFDENKNRYKIN